MRIDRFLVLKAIGSRSEVKKMLKKKIIFVNEVLITDPKFKLSVGDQVNFLDYQFIYQEEVYYLLNKPKGYVSATSDNLHDVVTDLLDDCDYQTDIFPVGRLDLDTTGLLLLTNDGNLAHKLTAPKHHVPKTYEVIISEELTNNAIKQLQSGVVILNDYLTKPAIVEIVECHKILLTITEGKFHQVKEMLKAVDNQVLELKRVAMGNLKLPSDLLLGDYVSLSYDEIIDKTKENSH